MARLVPAGTKLGWQPQPGSQSNFLLCPIFECLYEGTRGPGKTDALLFDFAQEVGKGYGVEWRGILFRRTYPELADVVAKSKKWFSYIYPAAKFNESKMCWKWPTGEVLFFRHMMREADYWSYHGHAYPWIGWEELCTWPNDICFTKMFSCARSTVQGLPIRVRATTNPYGPGHNWVKRRYKLPASRGRLIRTPGEPDRIALNGKLEENRVLLDADPTYIDRLKASARNPAELKAWLYASWDIVAGGMFDDVWDTGVHILPRLSAKEIPRWWRIDRSFDWGSAKPFSVGWWAESNGEPIVVNGRRIGAVKGDLIRFSEWYGSNGRPNEGLRMLAKDIAQGILDREDDLGIRGRAKIGVADSSIFDVENGNCIAEDMKAKGVFWEPADKGPGSRKQGWEQCRNRLKGAMLDPGTSVRETKGLFVTENCRNFIELFPVLPRDDKDLDDVDTDAEDHIGDDVRYRVRHERSRVASRRF